MKRVDIVCIGIFVFFLAVAGVVSLIRPAGAVLPLFMAMVWGWWYLNYKMAGDQVWLIQKLKKKPAEETKGETSSTESNTTKAETEKDTKKEEDDLSESTEESQNK